MPVPSTTRAPIALTSRPTPSADASRIRANALTTAAAAVRETPKLRAKIGMAGATIPNPPATKNATTDSTPTSGGRPARRARSRAANGTGNGLLSPAENDVGVQFAGDDPTRGLGQRQVVRAAEVAQHDEGRLDLERPPLGQPALGLLDRQPA